MSMQQVRPFLSGQWCDGESESTQVLTDKFTDAPVAAVHQASRQQVDTALTALAEAQSRVRWEPYQRFEVLCAASALLTSRREAVARTIVADAGFTISDALREVDRAAQTLQLCGEEAKRLAGEVVPMQGAPGSADRLAFTVYHPVGVVCAITPFNSPLNTVCHKVGPALAAGNAVVLKPASATPLTAALLVELLLEAGVPPELLALVYGSGRDTGQWLLESRVPAFYAFTGSTGVGEHILRTVGLRRVQLELGSLSSTLICADADLERAVPLCTNAAFRKAGQVCTSVQRLYVHGSVLDEVVSRMAAVLRDKRFGDPTQPDTFVGPLISPSEAERVGNWVAEAVSAGATAEFGGRRTGNVVEPTVLSGVAPDMQVVCEEVFGPVVTVRSFDDLNAAIEEINDTPFGLAAGIFTADLASALTAARRLRMGSVHINETSSSRVDLMPYTGVKASGMGREGPHYAIREMCEERLITIGFP